MITGLLLAIALAIVCYALSGARSSVYLLYYLAFIPFVSLDPASGGLQELGGLHGQNVMIKMAIRVVTTAGFVLLLLRQREALRTLLAPAFLPILAYFLWALVGLHRAHSPWVSFLRLGEFMSFTVAGLALYLESGRFHGARDLARWHCLALLPLCGITVYYAQVEPALAVHVSAEGMMRLGHKLIEANVLGFAAVAVHLWATHELKEPRQGVRSWKLERLLPLVALCIATYVLVLARSRTAMFTAVAGHLILWMPYIGSSPRRRVLAGAILLGSLCLTIPNVDRVAEWFLRGESIETLVSGTGRTELWGALIREQVPDSPLLGAGYLMLGPHGTFEHAGSLWNNAHNTYLFALVSTGIPGLLLIAWISTHPMWCLLRRVHIAPREERAAWSVLLAMTVVVGITNLTGFGISGYPNAAMFFYYAIYPLAVLERPGEAARRVDPAWAGRRLVGQKP